MFPKYSGQEFWCQNSDGYKIMYHENEHVNTKKVGNTFNADIKKTLLWALHKLLGQSNIISVEETRFIVSEHP